MPTTYRLDLNFLPIRSIPAFRIFRAERTDGPKPHEMVFAYSLPVDRSEVDRKSYWVSFDEVVGFEEFEADPNDNNFLTLRALFEGLRSSAQNSLLEAEYEIPRNTFHEELAFNFSVHPEGTEQLKIQPYYLAAKKLFGWLVDYHFRLNEGVPFSRRVQQLSLSLDKKFKRNLDCYIDRNSKIREFVQQRKQLLSRVRLPDSESFIIPDFEFVSFQAKRLRSKSYIFANEKDAKSQFNGLHLHGPLEPLASPPKLLFAFRERDRQAARILAKAIKGTQKRERFSFPGFEPLFKTRIEFDPDPIILDDLSIADFQAALERVKAERNLNPSTVPIFVLPDGDDNGYKEHKAIFTHEGIPTQVCTLKLVNDDYALKWSIANIALQVFCKAGGKPWKVRPTPEKTLIVGISQSHKIRKEDGRTKVDKYFAFSVLTDNSGLFQQLCVLGDSDREATYLKQLTDNLRNILSQNTTEFSQVVVHSSFRLKRKEMVAIETTVKEVAGENLSNGCRFAVVKINHRNRFFGINPEVNSLVPYEGTYVDLGAKEKLIWFEGIFPDKKTVTKAFPGPTHLKFLRTSEEDAVRDELLLQDLVNLSGCNWRGFNAKSAPVSVFYCHLVADMVHDFHEGGLPLPKVSDLRPWFL